MKGCVRDIKYATKGEGETTGVYCYFEMCQSFTSVDKQESRLCLWIAKETSSVISSFSVTPVLSQTLGYILISVNPGNVLISFRTNLFW